MMTEQFFGKNYHYIWSDGWCLDKNKAWFLAGSMNILFCLDLETKKTNLIDAIPSDNVCAFRRYPRCVKRENVLICIPDIANDIWFYHLSNNSWKKTSIINPQGIRLLCCNAWFIEERLYVVSLGLKQIIEIDMEKEVAEHYYKLPIDAKKYLSQSVLVDDCIYNVASYPVNIYEFSCSDKSIKVYELPEIDDEINTLAFDGNKFWLSGKCRKIYIWDKKTNDIIILDEFPDSFGIWNFSGKYENLFTHNMDITDTPMFFKSVVVGKYVWFVPFQTNDILYVDKETLEVKKFIIDGEEHDTDDVKQQLLQHKYLLEYIKDDRYIGLFSLKNKYIIEIDSCDLKYNIMDYYLDKKTVSGINKYILSNQMNNSQISFECEWGDLFNYCDLVNDSSSIKDNSHFLGKNIYSFIKD